MRLNINKILVGLLLAAAPAASAEVSVLRARYVMGTVCEITALGPGASAAVSGAFAEIERWDAALSSYRQDSEVSRLARWAGEPAAVSERLWEALSLSLEIARLSEGAFDPTVAGLRLEAAPSLPWDGLRRVSLNSASRRVSFIRPVALDFGGIGKGLALDHAAVVLRRRGVRSALLNFGGQVYALGAPSGERGWPVRLPGLAETVFLKDASASVSGDGERPGHIVSPFSGLSVAGDDVVVVAASAAEADAWSTALYVLGGRAPAGFKACLLRRDSDLKNPRCARYGG